MEVIRLPGYIAKEKMAIGKQHLWPKALKNAGIRKGQLKLADSALSQIIEGYAREAGVRNLEKQLNRIIRKAAVKLLSGETRLSVTAKNLTDYLGEPYFRNEMLQTGVGVVTGLAWTSMGGTTLSIEASRVHNGNRGLKQTGQLGEVMKESSEIAYSYVASHLDELGGKGDWFKDAFVHLHVPEGATPKDGPSAGITMACALVSLATGRAIKRRLAMTGELTLTGQVLAIGGVREKVVAARRVGIHELILPEANRRDYDELPAYLREKMRVHFASHYRDVYQVVFGKNGGK
jgi:ATP-dependent Lon protease